MVHVPGGEDALGSSAIYVRCDDCLDQRIAVDHHRKWVPQSQRYYEKKRAEGKRHS
jgi:hypothetical protein